MFEKMAQRFMNQCYLSGPGTHKRIVAEMAEDLRLRFWTAFWLGLCAGSVATLVIVALVCKFIGGF